MASAVVPTWNSTVRQQAARTVGCTGLFVVGKQSNYTTFFLRSFTLRVALSTHWCQSHEEVGQKPFWWPHLDSTIEQQARSCASCNVHQDMLASAPLYHWSWPNTPCIMSTSISQNSMETISVLIRNG